MDACNALWTQRQTLTPPLGQWQRSHAEGASNWTRPLGRVEAFELVEVTRQLKNLDAGREIRTAVRNFVMSITTRGATVPSVAPGERDGDVTLHWVTGPMSMEVEVTPSGAVYLWARDDSGEVRWVEDDVDVLQRLAKYMVARMADRARLKNPNWREQYVSHV